MNDRCFMANVTYDNSGKIVKVVPIKSTSNTTIFAAKGGLLSNPLLIGAFALAAIILLGGKNANG